MKQTVKELFSPDEQLVFLTLMWTGRSETPDQVAGRVWATAAEIRDAVPDGDPRIPETVWAGEGDADSNLFALYSHTLQALEQRARDSLETGGKGAPDTLVTLRAALMSPGPNGTGIASYSVGAGKTLSSVPNTATIRFKPGYPLGSPAETAELFRKLVRIWQPDTAKLTTFLTFRQIPDNRRTAASYLVWLAQPAFGSIPGLPSVEAETFGDGTLLTVREWSIDGVHRLHKEMLAGGLVWKITHPLKQQTVPRFPPPQGGAQGTPFPAAPLERSHRPSSSSAPPDSGLTIDPLLDRGTARGDLRPGGGRRRRSDGRTGRERPGQPP